QNDVTLKMPAFEWVHVQLHQQKGMISLSPPTICNSADKFIYNLEQRWTRKLLVSSMSGQTEAMRQKGMYVDLDGDAVTSSPLSVDGVTSQYWINAADRALLILRDGNFKAPYGSLATYLESLERPFNPLEKALELDAQIKWLKDTNAW
ncbi:hypothetical protein, partial [Escherichia coli]